MKALYWNTILLVLIFALDYLKTFGNFELFRFYFNLVSLKTFLFAFKRVINECTYYLIQQCISIQVKYKTKIVCFVVSLVHEIETTNRMVIKVNI